MSFCSTLPSLTSISRTSIHTDDRTIALVRICDDINCLYPYGSACELCSVAFDIKEEAVKKKPRHALSVAAWVDELKVNRAITVFAGEEFTGGADVVNPAIPLIERQAAVEENYVHIGDAVDERRNEPDELDYEADDEEADDFDDAQSDVTQVRTTHVRSLSFLHQPSDSSSLRIAVTLPPTTKKKRKRPISSWLDTVLHHTINSQLEDEYFIGGADDEQEPGVDNCELCGRPMGDPTDQHYLKCKYAHEEAERMARWGWYWGL